MTIQEDIVGCVADSLVTEGALNKTNMTQIESHARYNKNTLIVGCNYQTTWQSHGNMRFVLAEIKGTQARLMNRNTKRNFWSNVDDIIFIMSPHNIIKAETIESLKQGKI
jgi:hypothetical protein